MENRSDGFTAIEDKYAGYTVYDNAGSKIGKVDDLFLDENDQPEYIGVKTGFLGTKSTLIPMELARVNDRRKLIEVAADKHTVTEAPTFDDAPCSRGFRPSSWRAGRRHQRVAVVEEKDRLELGVDGAQEAQATFLGAEMRTFVREHDAPLVRLRAQ